MAVTVASHNTVTWVLPNTYNMSITCSAGDVIYVLSTLPPSLTGETFSSIASLSGGSTLYRCAASSNHSPSNISFSLGSPNTSGAIGVAFTGVDNSSNVVGSVNSSGGTTISASATTAFANSYVALFTQPSPGGTPSAGAGYTLIDYLNFNTILVDELANSATPTSGTVVTPTISLSGPTSWSAVAVSLKPSGAVAPTRRRANVLVID